MLRLGAEGGGEPTDDLILVKLNGVTRTGAPASIAPHLDHLVWHLAVGQSKAAHSLLHQHAFSRRAQLRTPVNFTFRRLAVIVQVTAALKFLVCRRVFIDTMNVQSVLIVAKVCE